MFMNVNAKLNVCGLTAFVFAVLLAACGGGDDSGEPGEARGVSRAQAIAISSDLTQLPGASTSMYSETRKLREFTYDDSGPTGWGVNTWPENGSVPSAIVDLNTDRNHADSGTGSVHFKITTAAANFRLQAFGFEAGKRYRVTARIKSPQGIAPELLVRGGGPAYPVYAHSKISGTGLFQSVSIEGITAEAATLFLYAPAGQDIYLDSLVISEVVQAPKIVRIYSDNYDDGTSEWIANQWSEEGSVPSAVADINLNPNNTYMSSRGSGHFKIIARAANFRLKAVRKDDPAKPLFEAGKRYRVTAQIKSPQGTITELLIRGGGPVYPPYAFRQIKGTGEFQSISIEGVTAEQDPNVFLYTPVGVDVYVDDLEVVEVLQDELAPFNAANPIPDTLFGLHLNKAGLHQSWPRIGQSVIRLHDTGSHWCNLETAPGSWIGGNDDRLQTMVDFVRQRAPSAHIIYTMGQTPSFYAENSTANSYYCTAGGTKKGASSPPSDMTKWRDYVRRVGLAYKGKISYWEIWNEWDIPKNYSGSVAQMVEMTRIAHQELKAIDPANKIVAPSVTARLGTQHIDRFLRAGGAQYIDIVNFHAYEAGAPETMLSAITNVREIMVANNIGNKPLWNTEGGFSCDKNVDPTCDSQTHLGPYELANPLRYLVLMALKGVANFNYYHWEGRVKTNALVYGTWEDSTSENCANYDPNLIKYNPACPTPLGKNYAQAVTWLRGATLVDAYKVSGKVGSIYVFKLQVNGAMRVILWTEGDDEVVLLHKEGVGFSGPTWDRLKFQSMLDGKSVKTQIPEDAVAGDSSGSYKYVTVSKTPLLLTVN
jgi:hypothetical protein